MRYRLDTVKTVISKDNSSFHGKTSSGCQISEEDLMAIAASAEQLQSMMDKELVQSLSQQYIQEHGGMEKKVHTLHQTIMMHVFNDESTFV